MDLKSHGLTYLVTAVIFLALDAIWLTLMTSRLYRPFLGDLLSETPSLPPALLFYLIYVLGMVVFVVQPALARDSIATAAWQGALLGFVCYATYDLTNQATLRHWPTVVTVADLAWGTFVTGAAAALSVWVVRRLGFA